MINDQELHNMQETIFITRKLRHDFMNDIQVLYGYTQVGKYNEVNVYIEKLAERNQLLGKLYTIDNDYLSFCLEENIRKLWGNYIEVDINFEIEKFKCEVFKKEYNKNSKLVNNIFNRFVNNNSKIVYIYFFEDGFGKSLLICNNETVEDEINWMENWKHVQLESNCIEVYECIYGSNLGYRLVF